MQQAHSSTKAKTKTKARKHKAQEIVIRIIVEHQCISCQKKDKKKKQKKRTKKRPATAITSTDVWK